MPVSRADASGCGTRAFHRLPGIPPQPPPPLQSVSEIWFSPLHVHTFLPFTLSESKGLGMVQNHGEEARPIKWPWALSQLRDAGCL